MKFNFLKIPHHPWHHPLHSQRRPRFCRRAGIGGRSARSMWALGLHQPLFRASWRSNLHSAHLRLEGSGRGDAGASGPPLRTMASLAQSITIGNSSQAWQSDLSSGASTWARPRHSTQSLCASEKSTGLPHMRQRDILSVILYSARMQEGIAICVVHSSRVGQRRNQAPGEGERFWGILAPDPPT